MKTDEKKGTLYLCDPQKNTECSKTGCQNSCFMTANKAYAKIDDDGTETRYYYPQGSEKITVTYTMVKPDRNEIAETQITLPVSNVVAQLVDAGTGLSDNMVRRALEPIANLQGYVLDKIKSTELLDG
nr:MAG TPA: hypothetical protein [Caudoviricetes sp.]